jgi:malonyl-CoA O-methyltransferase
MLQKIIDNFSKAATQYEKHALVQKKVAQELVKKISSQVRPRSKILDLGCGTGFLGDFILHNSPAVPKNIARLDASEAMLVQNKTGEKILANIENPPFKEDRKFDFIVSSMAFQWLSDPIKTISKYQKFLSPRGVFICKFLGQNTFFELKDILQECQIKLNLNQFISINNLRKKINKEQFIVDSNKVVLQYKDVFDLLGSIKKIGAGNSNYKNRLSKSDFNKINKTYFSKYSINKNILCSWEVITILNKNEAIF